MKRTMTSLIAAALILTATGAVQAETQNCWIPICVRVYNPCTDECVRLSGWIHLNFGITYNCNTFHLRGHANFGGLEGEGCYSCNEYVGNGAANFNLNCGAAETVTFVGHFNLIGQGSTPNLRCKALFHITVNANGELTAEVCEFECDCQGGCPNGNDG